MPVRLKRHTGIFIILEDFVSKYFRKQNYFLTESMKARSFSSVVFSK